MTDWYFGALVLLGIWSGVLIGSAVHWRHDASARYPVRKPKARKR